ncbi:helix-turn-helix DNA binding domain protein [Arthrobacter phage EastWest]|uniref:Helix-turn-helix DNA binding domain protein n=1 Tax=Arthrobacter phage EastWest TaxID=2894292 RepID=A0AAE9C8T5_9CAUD|nr:helix-turn-helix DNA binding domain protein [Arthrobacter phage EastWest]
MRGMEHDRAKLTDEEVLAIRLRAQAGETLTAIAADYPITIAIVHRIVTGKGWTHVDGPIRPARPYRKKQQQHGNE